MFRLPIIFLALVGGGASSHAGEPPPAAVPWTALHFEARKLALSATSVIRRELLPAAELAGELREPPGKSGVPLPAWVVQLSVETDLPVGRDERVSVWLHPGTFAALQTDKRTFGRRPYVKLLRYSPGGYYEWRRAPADEREALRPPHDWSALREGWAGETQGAAAEIVVADPYALLYIVSAAQLQLPRRSLTAWIVSRGRLVKLAFADSGLTRRQVDHLETWTGGERRRRADALVRLVRVSAAASGGEEAHEPVEMGFLGMQDGLTIALDATSGIPLELSGRARTVGSLVVRLTRAELSSPPQPQAASRP